MARRMKRAASALLPPSFWPSSWVRARRRSAMACWIGGVGRSAPSAKARSSRAIARRAISVEWPFSSRIARNSARAAAVSGLALPKVHPLRLPLLLEDAHRDLVPMAPIAVDRVAQASFEAEPRLLVGAD